MFFLMFKQMALIFILKWTLPIVQIILPVQVLLLGEDFYGEAIVH